MAQEIKNSNDDANCGFTKLKIKQMIEKLLAIGVIKHAMEIIHLFDCSESIQITEDAVISSEPKRRWELSSLVPIAFVINEAKLIPSRIRQRALYLQRAFQIIRFDFKEHCTSNENEAKLIPSRTRQRALYLKEHSDDQI
ncbi:hypothetical protein AAG906_018425 [Vitis piasezkii]